MTKNQLTPLSSPKGHATLTLTILDGHFSDQVKLPFLPLCSFHCQPLALHGRRNKYILNWQTRFGLGHTSLHYNTLLDAVGGVDACCKPGGLKLANEEYAENLKISIPGEGGKRKVSSFVLDSLPPKMRDKGVKSKKYKQVHTRIIILSPYIYIMFYRRSPFSWLWR